MYGSQVSDRRMGRQVGRVFVAIVAVAVLFGLQTRSGNQAVAAEMQDETLVFSESRGAPGKGWPNVWTESPHSYWL